MDYDEFEDEREEIETSVNPEDVIDPALQKMIDGLQINKELATSLVKSLGEKIQSHFFTTAVTCMKEAMKIEIGRLIAGHAREHFHEVFKEIIAGDAVIANGTSWNAKTMSIKDVIKESLDGFINKYSNERERKVLIQSLANECITEEMARKVKTAVEEIKKEVVTEIKESAIKSIVQHTAQTLASDPRLLQLMVPSK